jgi:hypothetical protein
MQPVKTRLLPVAGVVLALVALSGCDQSPLSAADVGPTTISVHDVNLMAQALCTEQTSSAGGAQAPSAVSAVNQSALAALVQSAVDAQYAAKENLDYDRLQLASQVTKLDPLIAKLPQKDQARTRELITDLFRGELQLFQQGAALVQQSGQQATQQSVQIAANKLEADFAATVKIKVNPRFNTVGSGHGADGFQSVSRSVSTTATAAQSATPDPAWVLSLPSSQRCG